MPVDADAVGDVVANDAHARNLLRITLRDSLEARLDLWSERGVGAPHPLAVRLVAVGGAVGDWGSWLQLLSMGGEVLRRHRPGRGSAGVSL